MKVNLQKREVNFHLFRIRLWPNSLGAEEMANGRSPSWVFP